MDSCETYLNDPVWTHVKRIGKHDLPGCGMDTECTHICIYPISDDEADGSKRFCNIPMKLSEMTRTNQDVGAPLEEGVQTPPKNWIDGTKVPIKTRLCQKGEHGPRKRAGQRRP